MIETVRAPEYDRATNPYELFGEDALGNLERKLRLSAAHPNSSAHFVRDEEVERVCNLHDPKKWPPLASRRRAAIAAGNSTRPRGSPGRGSGGNINIFVAICVYDALMYGLKGKSNAELAKWCADGSLTVEPLNRGNAVAEYVRASRFPMMSRAAVRNLISLHRPRFFVKD
jgi:hypothetical protein